MTNRQMKIYIRDIELEISPQFININIRATNLYDIFMVFCYFGDKNKRIKLVSFFKKLCFFVKEETKLYLNKNK